MVTLKTHREPLVAPTRAVRVERSTGGREVPILQARNDGPAERVATRLGGLHPAVGFVIVMLAGFAAIASLSIGLGFFVTQAVEDAWGVGAAGEGFNVWLARHRTSALTDASWVGSTAAGGLVLPIIVGSVAAVCAVMRKWRIAAFAVFVLAVESGAYRATTLVVHSHRPNVPRLEGLPVNASYPSGHTAAAIAVYGGLVLLLTSSFTNRAFRVSAWTFVLGMVTFVALARMYRGMHHPLDVAGGVVIGIAAVIALVFACRTAGAVSKEREHAHASAGGRE